MWYRYKVKDGLGSIHRGVLQQDNCYKAVRDINTMYSNCNILDCTVITNSDKENNKYEE